MGVCTSCHASIVVHQGSGSRVSPLRGDAAAEKWPVISAFPDADAKGLTSASKNKPQDEKVKFIRTLQERDSSGSFSSVSTASGSSLDLSANINALDIPFLRAEQVGVDRPISTPFGERTLLYADFTASGRALHFVEQYMTNIMELYANSHTEDNLTGRTTTHLLHDAESKIKAAVNAGEDGRIIPIGTGATGAIYRLQEMLGVAIPPATREALTKLNAADGCLPPEILAKMPVVFVGPYEHHSNEVTWRESLATVVVVQLAEDGGIDLNHLEEVLKDEQYKGRMRIGSFSAASNVTGMKTDIHAVASLLHQHGSYACFDYAAAGPYVEIDMNPSGRPGAHIDAIFLSMHKFLGGPGSSGILVINKQMYPSSLPPTVGGGGTVAFVSPTSHIFVADIEEREKAGTPGSLQVIKAALAMSIKQAIGTKNIEAREEAFVQRAFEKWAKNPGVVIYGNLDPHRRLGIVSFNIKDSNGKLLHPRLTTVLLNDLFGIQARGGCSCAGPYGHRLQNVSEELSLASQAAVEDDHGGMKFGWCRVGFHFSMDDTDAAFITDAIDFLGNEGPKFLSLYRFNLANGGFSHFTEKSRNSKLELTDALSTKNRPTALSQAQRQERYAEVMRQASYFAQRAAKRATEPVTLEGPLEDLQYFSLVRLV
eukprot:CAMPEP_0202401726 /NCGR_PEP_ID=MMETSP1128-20130828/3697_1 /ASSEMBLY_ACC=CAM_ASM_000463 /TAXON_ID=3047 /ORGANISM="Dunaliella tertiolecta, Strain CCMP1320" /LENGTH=653 /DNA_ID=CAMNT_0049005591 /DNA_START=22 /DNA_END=1983 /DNA_ORIENTATION=+